MAVTHPVGPAPRSKTKTVNRSAQCEFTSTPLTFTPNLWLDYVDAVDSASERFGCGEGTKQ